MFGFIDMPIFADNHIFIQEAICAPYCEKPPLPPEQMVAASRRGTCLANMSEFQFNINLELSLSSDAAHVSFCDTDSYKGEQSRLVAEITHAKSEWSKYLLDPHASVDVDQISETIDHLYDTLYDYGPGAIDLSGLTPESVSGEHLAAILRATSSWSSFVIGWIPALDIAKRALLMNDQNPYDALLGLIETDA